MRKEIYLTQDEIDSLVQKDDSWKKADFNSLRALQDGLVDEVTYPDKIIRRKGDYYET